MFDLFSRARRQSRPARPTFRPMLENLEERNCPTTINVTAMVVSTSKTVTFHGSVGDTQMPGGMIVQLSGVATGSTTTDANGNFSVQLTATALGTETAATTGASASTTLTDPGAPLISLYDNSEYPGGYYLFTGHVNGIVFAGEQITFSGSIPSMDGQTTPVKSDGTFSFVGHLLPGEDGDVLASATADVWGVNNVAVTSVDQQS
jgi:hypothetical protein